MMDDLRARMEKVTLEMTRLMAERTRLARQIGEAKRELGVAVEDARREAVLREAVLREADREGLGRGTASRLLSVLLRESHSVQGSARQAGGPCCGSQTPTSVLARARELEKRGRKIIHMEIGELDLPPPPEAGRALARAVQDGHWKYGAPEGQEDLRSAIARKEGAEPEKVLVTAGARFAVFASMMALLDPGDEVVVIEPAWPAYRDCAARAGAKARAVRTELEGGWIPDPAAVSEAVSANTRMLVLNYPNNPTGAVLPAKVQDELVGIASDAGLYVLGDEIYRPYSRVRTKPLSEYGYEKSISVQSLSKSHAMTGFRAGYAVAEPPVVSAMARVQADAMTCVPAPVQRAALAALGADVSENARTVEARMSALEGAASEAGLEFARPDGAFYLFARTGGDGAQVCSRALEEGLAVSPGEAFGGYKEFVRLSACLDEKILKEAVGRLAKVLEWRKSA